MLFLFESTGPEVTTQYTVSCDSLKEARAHMDEVGGFNRLIGIASYGNLNLCLAVKSRKLRVGYSTKGELEGFPRIFKT